MNYILENCRQHGCKAENCGDEKCEQKQFNLDRLFVLTHDDFKPTKWLKVPSQNHCLLMPPNTNVSDPPVKELVDLMESEKKKKSEGEK